MIRMETVTIGASTAERVAWDSVRAAAKTSGGGSSEPKAFADGHGPAVRGEGGSSR
ncbi:hypothetical protein [Streptomyces sp. NPDC054975]